MSLVESVREKITSLNRKNWMRVEIKQHKHYVVKTERGNKKLRSSHMPTIVVG